MTYNIFLMVVLQLTFLYFLVDIFFTAYYLWKDWKAKKAAEKALREMKNVGDKGLLEVE
jgi:hypothetical protein